MSLIGNFFVTLFLAGFFIPTCYALPDGPPDPGTTVVISNPSSGQTSDQTSDSSTCAPQQESSDNSTRS